ncbi:Folate-biopterin transporter 1, chloroplastic, partial [Mucuna pruriens]
MDTYGVGFVFGVTTLLPLLALVVTFLVKEEPMFSTTRGENLLFVNPEFLETSNSAFYLVVLGCVKLAPLIASLLGVGHYNEFMKNYISPLVLSTFLLVHLYKMYELSVDTHHDFPLQ